MPIDEFQAKSADKSCEYCVNGFEEMRKISDPPLATCPKCGNPVAKLISAPSVGFSKSTLDSRAKAWTDLTISFRSFENDARYMDVACGAILPAAPAFLLPIATAGQPALSGSFLFGEP